MKKMTMMVVGVVCAMMAQLFAAAPTVTAVTAQQRHQRNGLVDMYVRMFDETVKQSEDNPTVGIVLCAETDPDIARYSILKGSEQLFATKYKLKLPTPQELNQEVARQKELLALQLAKIDKCEDEEEQAQESKL